MVTAVHHSLARGDAPPAAVAAAVATRAVLLERAAALVTLGAARRSAVATLRAALEVAHQQSQHAGNVGQEDDGCKAGAIAKTTGADGPEGVRKLECGQPGASPESVSTNLCDASFDEGKEGT